MAISKHGVRAPPRFPHPSHHHSTLSAHLPMQLAALAPHLIVSAQRVGEVAQRNNRVPQTPLLVWEAPADPEVSHSSSQSFHAFSPAKPFTTIASQKHHSFSEKIASTTSETLEKIRAVTRLRDKPLGCPGALRRDTGAAV